MTPSDFPRPTPHFWEQNATQLAGLIRALGVPSHRVDDLLQELYLRSSGLLAAVTDEQQARRWLFTVATNRCRLEHRQRTRWQRLLDRLASWSSPPQSATPAEDGERSAAVDAALDRLKPVEREVTVLRYFCELNSREIGEMLQMPEATVRSHLAKARRQLALDLADWKDP